MRAACHDDVNRLSMHARALPIRIWNLAGRIKMAQQEGLAQQMGPALADLMPMMVFHHQYDIILATDFFGELPRCMVMQGNVARHRGSGAVCIYAAPDQRVQPGRGKFRRIGDGVRQRRAQRSLGDW